MLFRSRAATIVGVIEDVRQEGAAVPSQPELYLCMAQIGTDHPVYKALLGKFMEMAVRTELAPGGLVPELRQRIQQANPHLAIGEPATMEEAVEDSIGAQKLVSEVIGVFGALVLVITIVGLYGLLSYLVRQRTREIGIRMALGADRQSVVGMVMRQTAVLMGAGTLCGVGLALASDRLLQRFLFGVSATDPWMIGLACLGLAACGMVAALLPARRAATINPVVALRAD